jgi:hypothetical protein
MNNNSSSQHRLLLLTATLLQEVLMTYLSLAGMYKYEHSHWQCLACIYYFEVYRSSEDSIRRAVKCCCVVCVEYPVLMKAHALPASSCY